MDSLVEQKGVLFDKNVWARVHTAAVRQPETLICSNSPCDYCADQKTTCGISVDLKCFRGRKLTVMQ